MTAPPRQRKRTPWLAILGLVILPCLYLLTVNWGQAFNSNILELLPRSDDSPEAIAARQMLNERLSYPIILQASAPDIAPKQLIDNFREAAQQPAFEQPFIVGERDFEKTLLPILQAHRETLFAADWLGQMNDEYARQQNASLDFNEWLAGESARRLDAFLERPESMVYAEEIPADPLLLLPSALEQLPPAPQPPADKLIAWIPVTVDPLAPEGQEAILSALASLKQQMQIAAPGYQQTASGVYDLALASASQTKTEVTWLNIEMAGAILILLLILAGRPGFLLLTLVPLAVACLWCVVGGLVVFGHIHVIALAVSSVVLGLAVDYAVHLAAKRGDGNLSEAWPKVRLPLATSCLSTCFGFLFLLLSPMDALRQVGVMAPFGLVGSLLAVRWLLPWMEPIAGAFRLRRVLVKPGPPIPLKIWAPLAAAAWIVAMCVLFFGQSFKDDIRDFQAPIGETLQRYRFLADSIKHEDVNERWYCFANSPALLVERLRQVEEQTAIKGFHLPVSDPDGWNDFAAQSDQFANAFRQALEQEGFLAQSFEPFFDKLKQAEKWQSRQAINQALSSLSPALQGPLQSLLMTDGSVWVTVFNAPPGVSIPKSLQPFTRELAQQKSLNRALTLARQGIVNSAGWGLLGITVCVLALFHRRGIAALALPAWSVSLGMAGTILLGDSLGILAVIGAILAFCLALDYGAFAASSKQPPASIRISAATTGCAFFILSFCSMPAVSQLGQVVALSVLFAWLGAELLCLPQPKANRQSSPA